MPFVDGELMPEPRTMLRVKMLNPWSDGGRPLECPPLFVQDFAIVPPRNKYGVQDLVVTLQAPTAMSQGMLFDLKEPPAPKPPLPPSEQLRANAMEEPWMTWMVYADALEEEGKEAQFMHGLHQLAAIKWLPTNVGNNKWRFMATHSTPYDLQRSELLFTRKERPRSTTNAPSMHYPVQYDYHPVIFKSAWECTVMTAMAMGKGIVAVPASMLHGTPS